MTTTVPPRNEIAPEHTWNAPSVFASLDVWEASYKAAEADLPLLAKFSGRLGESPALLAEALGELEDIVARVSKLMFYAGMSYMTDTSDQTAAGYYGRASGLSSRLAAASAFIDPELLDLDETTLRTWCETNVELEPFSHYIDNLFRQKAHVRSSEVEELLGLLADPFDSVSTTANMITDADFVFKPATSQDGAQHDLTAGTIDKLLGNQDREVRRTAWENYADQFLDYKNTLANNLLTSVKQNVFKMRARHYDTTLDMALSEINVPPVVFHNLIDIFKKNLPTWHKYWRVRKRALGVDALQPYDIWAPLTSDAPKVSFDQAVEWICDGLAPLGEDYVERVRKGCLEDRWVDRYPNIGKTAGAFSWGTRGTHPFILMSFNDDVSGMSTLAHELGHSMHSYLSWENQSELNSSYSLFVAEVASNFQQALVRDHLLKRFEDDKAMQITLLEEAFDNIHRYFFIMPTLARFELALHERIERGEGVSADDMINLMADLFDEAYGGEMEVDRDRVGITWAQFGHMYVDYYVYQYATGISGAHAILQRILGGVEGAVEGHRAFLSAGGSKYPVDALKLAGVDLSQPEPVEAAFAVLAEYVDRLDELTK